MLEVVLKVVADLFFFKAPPCNHKFVLLLIKRLPEALPARANLKLRGTWRLFLDLFLGAFLLLFRMTLIKLSLDIHNIRGKEIVIFRDFRRVSKSRHLRV